MTEQPGADPITARSETTGDDPLSEVRTLLAAANRRLLGDTITATDEDWRAPSRLPDWTRGHVATHIARNADALARLGVWARTGERQEMYPKPRDVEIEAGSQRTGLELQTDLDTSAGLLDAEFERIAGAGAWDNEVEHRGGTRFPARVLPLGRLSEVVIHHVDLGLNLGLAQIDVATAEHCLRWCVARLSGRDGYPTLTLISDKGATFAFGAQDHEEPATVRGPANLLLGWVTNRGSTDGLAGDLIELPSFG